jgi:two-component system cell cycle sensor histidine kinase PleC
MDNYVKLFSRLLIGLMLVGTLYQIVQFRVDIIRDLRIKIIQENAKGLATQYINNIWTKNAEAVDLLSKKEVSELYDDPTFISFAVASLNLVKDLPLVKLNIYNQNKKKFLSNNKFEVVDFNKVKPELNGIEDQTNLITKLADKFNELLFPSFDDVLSLAYLGQVQSQTLPNAAYIKLGEPVTKSALIQVVIPIIIKAENGPEQVTGLIELFYDVTREWQDIEALQNTAVTGAFMLFFFFLGILFYVSAKLEKLIEKQHEINVELSDAKAAAEEESIEKSKFLANISHELRTPLNAIIGFSEIIKTEALGALGNLQYRDYANDINNSGTHLLSLINDILDYSKAAAEKLQVDAIELDLNKILATSLRLVKPRAEEAKVNLVEDLPRQTIVLVADPKRLKQAVLNLLSNSVKFTPEGGSVTLSAWIEWEKAELHIQVKDTGIGIAEKDISKAMSTFGQVDSTISRKYEGTGLGLPLTKKLIELMKGKFEIKSEFGFGTIVTLIFPYPVSKDQRENLVLRNK